MGHEAARICFLSLDNLNRVPYLKKYVEWARCAFDVIYWDRSGLIESVGERKAFRYVHFVKASSNGQNKKEKVVGYLGFRRFAKKILIDNTYDVVIALTGNCAVLLSDILLKKYRGKYIIDIRDYWHEDFAPYHNIEQRLIKHSALTVISSPAYASFLIDHDYLVMHNDQMIEEKDLIKIKERAKPGTPFVVACIGGIKDADYDKQVINYFANDSRFEVRFIGRGYGQLAEYCKKEKIANVIIEDEFPMEETIQKYYEIDAILNMYGNHSPYYDYALSNKLYFAARLGMPIIVCKDTFMEEVCTKYDFGYAVDLSDQSIKHRILNSYSEEEKNARLGGCAAFLRKVSEDTERTKKMIISLFENGIVQ